MDHEKQQGFQQTKVERKTIEKNRRIHMKNLFSKLNSLLPNYNPKDALPLPYQVDETINYIKSLEAKVKLSKEKKEGLILGSKKSHNDGSTSNARANIKSPKIEIHEMGSSLQIIVTCGVDDHFIFVEIIRILHEENVDVISANSSFIGDLALHIVHAEIPQSLFQFGGSKIGEKLKRFVKGSSSLVEIEPQSPLLDFEIGTENWELLHSIVKENLPNSL